MTEPAIHCHRLHKRFASGVALDDFELEVTPGSILALLGPSGCGKTTALRIIAGFDAPDTGSVSVGGTMVVDADRFVPPEGRRVGMVFQDYALFPHMTVRANVGYGLRGGDPHRTDRVLELVGLTGYDERMPHELSGGEQQRVALARALAPSPEVILLDEPFSNLDAPQRERMRREVRSILVEAKTTAVFVTHDQEEALAIADVVAVMRSGQVLQVGTPDDVYRHPRTPWIAGFIGDSHFVDGVADVGIVDTPLGAFPQYSRLRGPVRVMIRPEWVHPTVETDGPVEVVDREFYGHDQLLQLMLPDGGEIQSRIGTNPTLKPGDRVRIGIEEVVLFPPDATDS